MKREEMCEKERSVKREEECRKSTSKAKGKLKREAV